MKLTILGKFGPFPPANGGTSSYLVRTDNNAIVLDFGACALSRIQQFIKLDKLNAVVLSHLHNDHISDILPLCYYLSKMDKKMDLYLPFTQSRQFEFIEAAGVFNLHEISEFGETIIGDILISFKLMTHPVKSYGMKVSSSKNSFFYSGDTTLNDDILPFAKDCKYLLLDCGNAPNNKEAPHMSLANAETIARETKSTIIATHLFPDAIYKSSLKNVVIADEMKTYNI